MAGVILTFSERSLVWKLSLKAVGIYALPLY